MAETCLQIVTMWDDEPKCRRGVLASTASAIALSGCLSSPADSSVTPKDPPTTGKQTSTAIRRTAAGVEATFRVVDGHRPTDDAVRATFEASRVVVTGTMDPRGCLRPTLSRVKYDDDTGRLGLVVGGKSPYGPTANVECGNASYDYRCVTSFDGRPPTRVDVIHDYHGDDERSFTVESE
jgi:hypothetical protein